MPAEKFKARQARLAAETAGLQRLAGLVSETSPQRKAILAGLAGVARRCQLPLILAFAGPPGAGRVRLLERMFTARITDAKPRRPGTVRILKHQSAQPEEGLPDGAEEFFLNEPALGGFVLLDVTSAEEAGSPQAEMHARLIPQADAVFFCFQADDPWHPPTWALIQAVAEQTGSRAAVVLLDAADLDAEERESRQKHFQQIAAKKFGSSLPILEVDTRAPDMPGLGKALGFVDTALAPGHPRVADLDAAEAEAARLAVEVERGLRDAATALRDEEFRLVELDRKLLTQHNWLRLQIDTSIPALLTASNAAIERASELFENETSPARMHNIFARFNRAARDLQEGVSDALRKLLTPRLEAVAAGLEEQIHNGWLAAASSSAPAVGERIRDALKAGPRLDELRQICRTRMDVHLGTAIAGKEMENLAARLISQSCSSLLLPVMILSAAVTAGLASAFQVGCELAGGAVVGLGVLGAVWAAVSGFNIRKILAKQYRQTLAFRTQHAIRLMQEEVRSFGTSLLDEIGRRVSEAAADFAASRKFLEPAIAEAARRANTLAQSAGSAPPAGTS